MAGELIKVSSAWTSAASALSLTAGTYVQVNASTIETLLGATEEDYPEFDIAMNVTSGTPTEGVTVEVHLQMGDGTGYEAAPSSGYTPHLVGFIILDNATGRYVGAGLPLLDKDSKIYLKSNESATTLTADISIRSKSFKAAA